MIHASPAFYDAIIKCEDVIDYLVQSKIQGKVTLSLSHSVSCLPTYLFMGRDHCVKNHKECGLSNVSQQEFLI